jgi:hypothetical protein
LDGIPADDRADAAPQRQERKDVKEENVKVHRCRLFLSLFICVHLRLYF